MKGIRTSEERSKSEATLRLAGRLVGGAAAAGITRRMQQLLERGVGAVTIDLGSARVIDCEGIGLLLRLREEANRRGAAFRVARTSRRIRRMLRLCSLLGLLEGEHGPALALADTSGHDAALLLPA